MKRFLPAFALCFVLCSSTSAEKALKPVVAEADETAELMTILKETDSTDTFLVTLQLVVQLEPERKGLLATVIRRADDMGLLKGMASGKMTAEQEAFSDAVEKIMNARAEAKNRNQRGSTSRNYAYPPTPPSAAPSTTLPVGLADPGVPANTLPPSALPTAVPVR
jgi:hypothetical protein